MPAAVPFAFPVLSLSLAVPAENGASPVLSAVAACTEGPEGDATGAQGTLDAELSAEAHVWADKETNEEAALRAESESGAKSRADAESEM